MFYIEMKLLYCFCCVCIIVVKYSSLVYVILAWNRWFLNFNVNMIDGFPAYHFAIHIKIYFK